jgi:hypothetical protein
MLYQSYMVEIEDNQCCCSILATSFYFLEVAFPISLKKKETTFVSESFSDRQKLAAYRRLRNTDTNTRKSR